MLINIVSSRRLMACDCGLVGDSSLSSSSENTLTQTIARCIIKCEGNTLEEGQTFVMNAYDCFGETTLMHAAVINDICLARCEISTAR